MKEVTVVAFCDPLMEHEDRVPAVTERTLTIDGSKPVVLDLCGECDKVIVNLLHAMESGAPIAAAKKAAAPKPAVKKTETKPSRRAKGQHPCLEAGCPQVSVSRDALGQHMRTAHGKGFKDYKRAAAEAAVPPVEEPAPLATAV